MQDFIIPFIVVGLAELGDKTQIAVFCLASKTKKYIQLLAGVILAFIITDGLAILLGNYITNIISIKYIKIISGLVFIIFGIITIVSNKEDETKCDLKKPFLSGFGMILISEMGDKTQITSGLFATKYNALMVFLGVISALIILSIMAAYLGKFIVKRINRKTISYMAGTLFIIMGIFYFINI